MKELLLIIEENHEAIVDIIIDEIGGTRLKAEFDRLIIHEKVYDEFLVMTIVE